MTADRNDDFRNRRREREREELKTSVESPLPSPGQSQAPDQGKQGDSSGLDALISQVIPLLEQLDRLYSIYLSGAEKMPPLERRKILDQLLLQLSQQSRLTQASQFRYHTTLASVQSHIERWDRLLKEFEKGQIKRRS
ncbi:hypothetical protein WDW86_09655 [Bdellovibrionota bacterium FG-2]